MAVDKAPVRTRALAGSEDLLSVPTRDQIRARRSAASSTTRTRPQSASAPYARLQARRPGVPRKTQPAVSDFDNDSPLNDGLPHESTFTTGRGLSGYAYRKSRRKMPKLKRSLRYGKYLEIPKGQRSIFQPREVRRRNRHITLIAILVALLVTAACLWILLT